jgi:hypothetical protein
MEICGYCDNIEDECTCKYCDACDREMIYCDCDIEEDE